jgi:hypothetical protein
MELEPQVKRLRLEAVQRLQAVLRLEPILRLEVLERGRLRAAVERGQAQARVERGQVQARVERGQVRARAERGQVRARVEQGQTGARALPLPLTSQPSFKLCKAAARVQSTLPSRHWKRPCRLAAGVVVTASIPVALAAQREAPLEGTPALAR